MKNVIRENTEAIRENTAAINRLTGSRNKKQELASRRKNLLDGVPYTREKLLAFKRQDLVMLAAQLGITKTSVPQSRLADAVQVAQADRGHR